MHRSSLNGGADGWKGISKPIFSLAVARKGALHRLRELMPFRVILLLNRRQEMDVYIRRALSACAVFPFLAGTVSADSSGAQRAPAWRDDFTARLEATALLETLNADLLSHDSATLTLDRWCDSHRL